MQPCLTELDNTGKYCTVTGVVLAGGKSTRMGTNKALLTLSGRPFIEIVADNLRNLFRDVVISADEEEQFAFLGLPVIPDIYKECGPLGGIHAVLTQIRTAHLFVVSCDLPLLSQSTIQNIVHSARPNEITVCKEHNRIHPLCGIYPEWFHRSIEKYLIAGKRSVYGALPEESAQYLDASAWEQELWNINTPPDYQRVISHN